MRISPLSQSTWELSPPSLLNYNYNTAKSKISGFPLNSPYLFKKFPKCFAKIISPEFLGTHSLSFTFRLRTKPCPVVRRNQARRERVRGPGKIYESGPLELRSDGAILIHVFFVSIWNFRNRLGYDYAKGKKRITYMLVICLLDPSTLEGWSYRLTAVR